MLNLSSLNILFINEPHNEKYGFLLCENKGADRLCSNCTADLHLYFHYTDSTIPLLIIFEISRFQPSFLTVQGGLWQTWLDPKDSYIRKTYP